jgi:hypothetical protein
MCDCERDIVYLVDLKKQKICDICNIKMKEPIHDKNENICRHFGYMSCIDKHMHCVECEIFITNLISDKLGGDSKYNARVLQNAKSVIFQESLDLMRKEFTKNLRNQTDAYLFV